MANPFDEFDKASETKNVFDQFDVTQNAGIKKDLPISGKKKLSDRVGDELLATDIPKALNKAAYAAGGMVTDALANLGLSPSIAAGAGFATNVGIEAIPSFISGNLGKTVSPLMEGTSKRLMQSAVKPTLKDIKSGDAAIAIQTLLDEGINPTKGGIEVLKSKIGDLNNEIKDAILASPATINKYNVWGPVRETLNKFRNQVNPETDLDQIRKAWTEFLNHPSISGKEIPVQTAQALKQGTYKILNKKYGEVATASDEAQKAIARGLKEQISAAVPEISALNAAESKLLKTLNVAERRALLDMNSNPMGLSLLANNPVTWAAFMADKSALFKSLAARMLYSGRERIPQAAGAATGAGFMMLENKLNPQSPESVNYLTDRVQ